MVGARASVSDALKPMQRLNAEIRLCRGLDQRSSTDGVRPYLGKVSLSAVITHSTEGRPHGAEFAPAADQSIRNIRCAKFAMRRTNSEHLKLSSACANFGVLAVTAGNCKGAFLVTGSVGIALSEPVRSVRVAPRSLFNVPV
jgi:hypothetical protein